ncbi:hypothetical protein Q6294_26245, partial [Klebsiella pneumoniae]|nr:hypothetical protein [Klebsiella pneumoniae]
EWVHVQLHQQKGMISLSPPTICNSAQNFPITKLTPIYTVYNDSDIVTRICRVSGMEGGTPLFHMIPE